MAQVGYGPLWRIDGPLPVPPEHGILAAAAAPNIPAVRIITDVETQPNGTGTERWLNGVQVYPYPPGNAQVFDTCAPGTDYGSTKDYGVAVALPDFGAITVYLSEICTSYKVWDQERFKARAVASLEAVESAALAYHFLSGNGLTLNPHLADGNGTFPNGDTVTSCQNGLQILEQQIAASGRNGIIHCTPMMATRLMGSGFVLSDRTGVVRTINGIVVVADFGYGVGATPAASAAYGSHAAPSATQEWAYASGPVDIYRSEIFTTPDDVAEAVERGTGGSATTGRPNSITYRAERYYLAVWDTEVQAAVLVDRCLTTC